MVKGDVVMVFGDPIKQRFPIGKAKLLTRMKCSNLKLEYWNVSFLDEPEIIRNVLISKNNEHINE